MKHLILFVVPLFHITPTLGQIPDSAAIDKIMWEAKWNKPNYPGWALGIFKDGEMVYGRGYGMANMEYNIPITTRSVFRIASVSKQFTAACIVLLVLRGQLNLDDTLYEFFPEFPGYATKITISHLLHHTSGIRDYQTIASLKGLTNDDYYSEQDIFRWLTRQQGLNVEPGEEYWYCNSGYWLLGQIVKKVSGRTLADFAQKEIFEPLGMSSTHFHDDYRRLVKNRATGYAPVSDGYADYEVRETNLPIVGNGGVFTSIEDIKKWDDAFYNSDRFGKDFWDLMTKPGILNDGTELKYGCGLLVFTFRGLKVVGHGGSSGSAAGFRSQYVRYPEQKFSVVIFANRADADPWTMSRKISELFFKDKFMVDEVTKPETKRESIHLNVEEMEQFTGNYWSRGKESKRRVFIEKDTLRYHDMMTGSSALIPVSPNEFYKSRNNGERVRFTRDHTGNWQMVELVDGKEKGVLLSYIPKKLTNNELTELAGKYYSEELETIYDLKMHGDSLFLYINNQQISLVESIAEDMVLTHNNGVFYFNRDDNGEIVGFNLEYFNTHMRLKKL